MAHIVFSVQIIIETVWSLFRFGLFRLRYGGIKYPNEYLIGTPWGAFNLSAWWHSSKS